MWLGRVGCLSRRACSRWWTTLPCVGTGQLTCPYPRCLFCSWCLFIYRPVPRPVLFDLSPSRFSWRSGRMSDYWSLAPLNLTRAVALIASWLISGAHTSGHRTRLARDLDRSGPEAWWLGAFSEIPESFSPWSDPKGFGRQRSGVDHPASFPDVLPGVARNADKHLLESGTLLGSVSFH